MIHDVFDRPGSPIIMKSIPNGTADIAEGIGLEPSMSVWDNEWVHSRASGASWPHERGAHGFEQQIAMLSRGVSKGLMLKAPAGLLDHVTQFAGVFDVEEVTKTLSQAEYYSYPRHSILANLVKREQEHPTGRFNGATFCSWINSTDSENNARLLGGQSLMTGAQHAEFNSKVNIMSSAQEAGYNVAPFVTVSSWDELETQYEALRAQAKKLGVDDSTAKYWVKLDGLSAGRGVLPFKPAEASFASVKEWIKDIAERSQSDMSYFRPLVMDLDIGLLPGVKRVIDNLCVQGIVGNDGVFVTGVTLQMTENGEYLGGATPNSAEEIEVSEDAKSWALPVLEDAQRKGYRGYAGIDVIMVETNEGGLRGYILEMNGRINSSTPTLSTAHWAAREAGEDRKAIDFTEELPRHLPCDFRPIKAAFNGLWYRGAESHYEGLIPSWMSYEKGNMEYIKMIAIGQDSVQLERLRAESMKIFAKLHP